MENKEIARYIKRLGQLEELYGANTFKTKAYAKAARVISKFPEAIAELSTVERSAVPGLGKSINTKIEELLETGSLNELSVLEQKTPPGVLQMISIKGIGPKKTKIIWRELNINSLGELWHACKAGALAQLKGFGQKTQAEIQAAIEFTTEYEEKYRYADIIQIAHSILNNLRSISAPETRIELTGAIRRRLPLIETLDFIVEGDKSKVVALFESVPQLSEVKYIDNQGILTAKHSGGISVQVFPSSKENFEEMWFRSTGNTAHVTSVLERAAGPFPANLKESEIYSSGGLAFVPPELREGTNELLLAADNAIPELITLNDLKGCLHNHSIWSDGSFGIKEMAEYCKDVLKLEYFGISDHSRTAAYAGGLSIAQVKKQWEEIDKLNAELAPFRIFKGIESDILNDGSLDYPDEILSGFDFVVSSIHAPLNMDEQRATERLIKAIENPYTTILGHPTGRQLLVRRGYPIDHKRVIDACAEHDVIIEINANPLRLDLDWHWLSYCIDRNVMVSINPDAHHTSELHYMEFGTLMARKGGIQPKNCLNCLNLKEINAFFVQRKKQRSNS